MTVASPFLCKRPQNPDTVTNARLSRCGLCLALVMGATLSAPIQADIYGHTDEDGTLNLSNYSTDERDTLLLKSTDNVTSTAETPQLAAQPYAPLVAEAARRHEVEPALLHAVITAESAYNAKAVSPKGAAGLMQLMPATARRLGVANVYDPDQNIQGGAQYLKELLERFDNDLSLTLAAYNAGEHAVARYGNRVPPYRETRGYVTRVLGLYRKYGKLLP
jgi:soluble lytic murein transglycosylase-like protein